MDDTTCRPDLQTLRLTAASWRALAARRQLIEHTFVDALLTDQEPVQTADAEVARQLLRLAVKPLEDSLQWEVVEKEWRKIGADHAEMSCFQDGCTRVPQALLRAIRAGAGDSWVSACSSAWAAHGLWLAAQLAIGTRIGTSLALRRTDKPVDESAEFPFPDPLDLAAAGKSKSTGGHELADVQAAAKDKASTTSIRLYQTWGRGWT